MPFAAPVVTMLYAALCGVLLIALALNIVRLRMGKRIPLGVGEGAAIEQPVRVHGNFTEYAPTFLILLLLAVGLALVTSIGSPAFLSQLNMTQMLAAAATIILAGLASGLALGTLATLFILPPVFAILAGRNTESPSLDPDDETSPLHQPAQTLNR